MAIHEKSGILVEPQLPHIVAILPSSKMQQLHHNNAQLTKRSLPLFLFSAASASVLLLTPALGGVAMLIGTYFIDLGVLLLMINALPPIYFAAKALNFIKLKSTKPAYLLGLLLGMFYMLSCWTWFYLFLQSTNIVDLNASGLDSSGAYWPWEDPSRFTEWIHAYVYQEDKRMASVGLMVLLGKLTGLPFFNEVPGLTGKALYTFWTLEAAFISWFIASSIQSDFKKNHLPLTR